MVQNLPFRPASPPSPTSPTLPSLPAPRHTRCTRPGWTAPWRAVRPTKQPTSQPTDKGVGAGSLASGPDPDLNHGVSDDGGDGLCGVTDAETDDLRVRVLCQVGRSPASDLPGGKPGTHSSISL